MTMDLFTDMNLEQAPLPAAFYNTTNISNKELKEAKAEATGLAVSVFAAPP